MAVEENAYLLIFRNKKQMSDFKKICLANHVSMRYVLQTLISEFIVEKRRVGLMP